jgi:hypothetical protein
LRAGGIHPPWWVGELSGSPLDRPPDDPGEKCDKPTPSARSYLIGGSRTLAREHPGTTPTRTTMTRPDDRYSEREARPLRHGDRRSKRKPIPPGIEADPVTERTQFHGETKPIPPGIEAGPVTERTQFLGETKPIRRRNESNSDGDRSRSRDGTNPFSPLADSPMSDRWLPRIAPHPRRKQRQIHELRRRGLCVSSRFRGTSTPIRRRNEPNFTAHRSRTRDGTNPIPTGIEADPVTERTQFRRGSKPIRRRNEPNFVTGRLAGDGPSGARSATTLQSVGSQDELSPRSFPGGRAR